MIMFSVLLVVVLSVVVSPSTTKFEVVKVPVVIMLPSTCILAAGFATPTPTPVLVTYTVVFVVLTWKAGGSCAFGRFPLVMKVAFKLDKEAPLPEKVAAETAPDAVMLLIENDRLASRSTIVSAFARAVAVVRALESVPAVIDDAFKLVIEAPSPDKVAAEMAPEAVMLLIENDLLASRSTRVSAFAMAVPVVRALESVPAVIDDAFKLVRRAPSPVYDVAFTVPDTSSLVAGLVVPIPTLPFVAL